MNRLTGISKPFIIIPLMLVFKLNIYKIPKHKPPKAKVKVKKVIFVNKNCPKDLYFFKISTIKIPTKIFKITKIALCSLIKGINIANAQPIVADKNIKRFLIFSFRVLDVKYKIMEFIIKLSNITYSI